jgi:SAM-dependent methyltransferase
MQPSSEPPPKFDAYASNYRTLVETSIKASGEAPEYFSEYKLNCLLRLGAPTREPVLDFGAGVGAVTTQLVKRFEDVTAYELSPASLNELKRRLPGVTAVAEETDIQDGRFSSAVCSGVLHHVPKSERASLMTRLRRKLRPGGRLFVFEHNPLNPLTRRAIKLCPFDDDAVLLFPWELRSLLGEAGFRVERLDFIVFFPRALAPLRPLEPYLRRVIFGAQTLTVASNPG